ncbi:MAG TPA: hypothetical protein VM165_12005 [Planctomycetaceae bacterium]|nr:hypothetical protein [Planctomycetaceae bacterium]
MKAWGTAIGWGLLVWLIPFLVAFSALPLKTGWRSLFESLMALTLAIVVVACSVRHWRRVERPTVWGGLWLGGLWFAICVGIDLPLMLSPPISYTLDEYAADIGLTYAMIPVITVGMAWAASQAKPRD